MRTIRDYKPELLSLIDSLKKAGCEMRAGSNGDSHKIEANHPDFIQELMGADSALLIVKSPSCDKLRVLYLVYGCAPGNMVMDFHHDEAVNSAIVLHMRKWAGKKQPTICI